MTATAAEASGAHSVEAAEAAEAADKRRWIILFLALIAQFVVVLDGTIVTVALPSIQTSLGFSSQLNLQWVINAYGLFFGGFLLLGGRAGDLLGRQRLFIAGLTLFTAASLSNGLAQSPGMLIAGRGVQGFGAALVSPAVLSIIIVTFTSATERTKALGYFTAVTASGAAAGMILGGSLTELSWRAIFLVNVPIGIVGVFGALRVIPNSRVAGGGIRTMDIPGAISVTGGITLLVYTIVNADNWGWTSGRVIGLLIAAVVLLAAFIAIEQRTRQPLVRLGIFAKRSLTASNATMFLMMGGMFVMMFFPTLYLAQNKGYSPIKVGLAYLPWPGMMAVAAGLGQKMLPKIGVRVMLVIGLLIVAVGLLTYGRLPTTGGYAADILPGMLLTALGGGLAWTTLFAAATAGVPAEESGLASGLINTSQQLGSALGLAVISSVAASRTSSILDRAGASPSTHAKASALVEGFQRGFIIAAIVLAASAVVTAVGLRRSDLDHQAPDTAEGTAALAQVIAVEG